MIDIANDPAAHVAKGETAHAEEAGAFVYNVNADGRVLDIEILSVTHTLAPGDWQQPRLPHPKQAGDAAEHLKRVDPESQSQPDG